MKKASALSRIRPCGACLSRRRHCGSCKSSAPRPYLQLIVLLAFLSALSPARAAAPLGNASCEALLQKLSAQVVQARPEARVGLEERLVALHEGCLTPEIDARVAGRAALLIVGQGTTVRSREESLTLLAPQAKRLRGEPLSPELIDVLRAIGGQLEALGRFEEAEASLLEALELRRQLFGQKSPEVAHDLSVFGDFFAHWSQVAEPAKHRRQAIESAEEAAALLWTERGPDDPATHEAIFQLEGILERLGIQGAQAEMTLSKYGWKPGKAEN